MIVPGRLGGGRRLGTLCWKVVWAVVGTGAATAAAGPAAAAAAPGAPLLVDVLGEVPDIRLDMPYARDDNLTGAPLYPAARCLLRPEVAAMLARAQAHLRARRPRLTLLVKDCYRPLSAQARLFHEVAGTPQQGYVANPNRRHGSVHTYGAAVDLTLWDLVTGRECDMGTPFDHLGVRAEPRREAALVRAGKLSAAQVRRRVLLREVMVAGGFLPISREWWHFDAWRGPALRRRYDTLDVPVTYGLVDDPSPAAAPPPPRPSPAR